MHAYTHAYTHVHATASTIRRCQSDHQQNNKFRKVIVVKSAKMDSVAALYKELKGEWEKPAQNLRKCGALIDQLKVNELFCAKIESNAINNGKNCLPFS